MHYISALCQIHLYVLVRKSYWNIIPRQLRQVQKQKPKNNENDRNLILIYQIPEMK